MEFDVPGELTFSGEPLITVVCAQWEYFALENYRFLEAQVAESTDERTQLRADIARARADFDAAVADAEGDELATADTTGCAVLYGAGAELSLFDGMRPCAVVGEDLEVQLWNRGSEAVSLAWPGADRQLGSVEGLSTGRIGDSFEAGVHELETEPYGPVTLYVLPRGATPSTSVLPHLSSQWHERALRGLSAADVSELDSLLEEIHGGSVVCGS